MAAPNYVFAPPATVSLPIVGTDLRFPVHRVYCVGRNFADHAIEMGHDPNREPPFFFQKSPDTLLQPGEDFPYPPRSRDVHHEVELVVALARGGVDIPRDEAMGCVFGYAVGLDMTRRDLQGEMKKLGRPWEVAKAFEASAPCGAVLPIAAAPDIRTGAIRLEINGEVRQSGTLDQMIWKVPEIIAELSGLFRLMPGDLIFAGTPAGVGPVRRGDRLHAVVEGIGALDLSVV